MEGLNLILSPCGAGFDIRYSRAGVWGNASFCPMTILPGFKGLILLISEVRPEQISPSVLGALRYHTTIFCYYMGHIC